MYLGGWERIVGDFHDEVGPDDVKDQQDGEEPVEYVVGGEHLHHLRRLHRRAEHTEYYCSGIRITTVSLAGSKFENRFEPVASQ